MPITSSASLTELEKYEMVVRIRDRVVRVTAALLLDAIDRGEDTTALLAHLREALDDAKVADDDFGSVAFGATPRRMTS